MSCLHVGASTIAITIVTRSISFVNKEGQGRRNEGGVEEEIVERYRSGRDRLRS